ncbi:cytochrome P450 3A4-like isoform X2 [Leptotrombidium deliense]|uniref:Cytochrome P450 3A4-like isoform X2 n=1 Tax=Leptotrombidium deliense TaxID=299467 RepID=A0A443SJP3_9ACAR|nr:cytochrome P450 3A4-like isoform X2 [Leptotrombidium deliense]
MLEVADTVDHVSTIVEEENEERLKSETERRDSMIIEITEKSSSKDLTAVTLLFMSCGYESITETLVSAVYFLSKNPKAQEKLMKEIDENSHAELSYDSLTKLRYLDAVVRETLRLYPPISRLERECVTDYKIGDVTIPKGMKIYVPIYALQRDADYYEQPEAFDPDRFLTEDGRNSDSDYLNFNTEESEKPFYPFGNGPRFCVGMHFSLFVTKLCLFKVYKNFQFRPTSNANVSNYFYFSINWGFF